MCLPLKPFKIEREWDYHGLRCAVVMNREQGHRCGYVRVPPGHPLHGKGYDDVNIDAHGGLTFAALEPCAHDDGTGWWFGFDCAHAGDAMHNRDIPADYQWETERGRRLWEIETDLRREYPLDEHYWTQAEVERETEGLAMQLAALTLSPSPTPSNTPGNPSRP